MVVKVGPGKFVAVTAAGRRSPARRRWARRCRSVAPDGLPGRRRPSPSSGQVDGNVRLGSGPAPPTQVKAGDAGKRIERGRSPAPRSRATSRTGKATAPVDVSRAARPRWRPAAPPHHGDAGRWASTLTATAGHLGRSPVPSTFAWIGRLARVVADGHRPTQVVPADAGLTVTVTGDADGTAGRAAGDQPRRRRPAAVRAGRRHPSAWTRPRSSSATTRAPSR